MRIAVVAILCLFVNSLISVSHAEAQDRTIAVLKDDVVILLDGTENELTRFAADSRPKSSLRWLPGGQRLSYRVKDDAGALGRLVIIDLKGTVLKELPIEPITDPPSFRPRYIAEMTWRTADKIRVVGSVNNWKCEVYDLNWQTGEISNLISSGCIRFVDSPDGEYTAWVHGSPGPEEEAWEGVEIEGGRVPVGYSGPEKAVFRIVAGPVWSPDSKRVAFVRKMLSTGETALATLSITGLSDRIPIPSHFDRETSLVWLGDEIAVRDETEMITVNHQQKKQVRASAALVAKVEEARAVTRRREKAEQAMRVLLKRLGAKDGVAWPE